MGRGARAEGHSQISSNKLKSYNIPRSPPGAAPRQLAERVMPPRRGGTSMWAGGLYTPTQKPFGCSSPRGTQHATLRAGLRAQPYLGTAYGPLRAAHTPGLMQARQLGTNRSGGGAVLHASLAKGPSKPEPWKPSSRRHHRVGGLAEHVGRAAHLCDSWRWVINRLCVSVALGGRPQWSEGVAFPPGSPWLCWYHTERLTALGCKVHLKRAVILW